LSFRLRYNSECGNHFPKRELRCSRDSDHIRESTVRRHLPASFPACAQVALDFACGGAQRAEQPRQIQFMAEDASKLCPRDAIILRPSESCPDPFRNELRSRLMPSSANGTNLLMLRTAFHQHPMPDMSLVDLCHAEDGSRWPTLCILESQSTGDRLYPYAFMIDRPQHGLCEKLIVPEPHRRRWDRWGQ